MPGDAGGPLRVLVVCTGNVCRSPAAERLLQCAVDDPGALVVRSAGTSALVGQPITEPMAALLTACGLDPGGFAARQLERSMIEQADVIIAMTLAHRSSVVTAVPKALARAVTLRELARACEADGALVVRDIGAPLREGAQSTVRRAIRARSDAPPLGRLEDIADPYGRDVATYRSSFEQINDAVRLLSRRWRAGPGVPGAVLAEDAS